MLTIPHPVLHDCNAVFRRALPKSTTARSATTIQILGGRDGIRLRLLQSDIGIEYHDPSPAEPFSSDIPMSALADCEGRGNGTVQFQALKNGHVELRWEQSGIQYHRDYAPREATPTPFPAWPVRDTANDPSLLEALDNAMQIPTGNAGRLSLTCVQLRGKQGDVVATDGRQLLIQGGFRFPWKDSVLVPRTPLFAARELPKGEVVHVAQSKTHVLFRIDGWTISLPIETSTRFPNVDAVIPKSDQSATRWFVATEEAPALAKVLDDLPAASEELAPVTLELSRTVTIRARAEEEKRCTEVMLPRSSMEGKASRVVTDRRFLQKALKLGFRSFQITTPDKPIVCKNDRNLFVWMLLDPKTALVPQPGALRVMLPAHGEKSRLVPAVSEPIKRTVPVAPVPQVAAPSPVRALDGFLNCARSLWSLVRKHHQQERVK